MTGIKVIDLIEPYPKGGKIGLFGGACARRGARRARLGAPLGLAMRVCAGASGHARARAR